MARREKTGGRTRARAISSARNDVYRSLSSERQWRARGSLATLPERASTLTSQRNAQTKPKPVGPAVKRRRPRNTVPRPLRSLECRGHLRTAARALSINTNTNQPVFLQYPFFFRFVSILFFFIFIISLLRKVFTRFLLSTIMKQIAPK